MFLPFPLFRRPGDLEQHPPPVVKVENPITSPIGQPPNPDAALPTTPNQCPPTFFLFGTNFAQMAQVETILRSNPFEGYFPEEGKASDWITYNSPVYDGDLISLKSPAFKGSLLQAFGASVIGNTTIPNPTRDMGPVNMFSFMIRRVILEEGSGLYRLENPTLTNPRSIGFGPTNLFILISTSEKNKVMKTKLPDQTAFATVNSNEPIILGEFPYMTKEGYKRCQANTLGTAAHDCINKYSQATAIWYFEREKRSGLNAAVTPGYGRSVLVRNYYAELIDRALYNGGRNLTIAGGSGGHVIKTSGSNNDSDDKSVWTINTWGGDVFDTPLPRYGPRAEALEAFGGPIQERINKLNEQGKQILKCEMEKKMKRLGGNYTYDAASKKWIYDDNTSASIRDKSVLESVKGIEKQFEQQKDPRTLMEKIFNKLTGANWTELNVIERKLISVAAIGSIGFLSVYSAERLIDRALR